VVEDLASVVLLVLNGVEREVKLSEKVETFNELQLQDFDDVVEGEVKETE